jgi:hypothetical protein
MGVALVGYCKCCKTQQSVFCFEMQDKKLKIINLRTFSSSEVVVHRSKNDKRRMPITV